jgi:hypothetical protein
VTVPEPTTDVVVFAPMGSNPSLLVTLAWKLWSSRRWRVVAAYAPVLQHGRERADGELFPEGGALEQLHEVVGADVLPSSEVVVPVVTRPDGTALGDEDDDVATLAYQEAVFASAKSALARAGDRPLVFGLLGGRRRTITVAAAVVAQILARPRDLIVDLRIRPHEASQPGAFCFPDQRKQRFEGTDGRVVVAREVMVELVEVQLPRLGALDPSFANAPSFEALLARAGAAIDEVASLRLRVDLRAATRGAYVTDDRAGATEEKVPLADTHLVYLASLVIGHQEHPSVPWLGVVRPGDLEHPFARLCRELDWAASKNIDVIEAFVKGAKGGAKKKAAWKTLPQLRSKARAALRKFAAARDPRYRALVPEVEKPGPNSRERLPLRRVRVDR